jgi:hypothetical protein
MKNALWILLALRAVGQQMAIDDNVALKIVNKVTPGSGRLGIPSTNQLKSGLMHRVFNDPNSHKIFAYDIQVTPPVVPGGPYRIATAPVDPEYARISQMANVPTVASAQAVDCKVGMSVSIDLLYNAATSETVSDVFTLVDRNAPAPPGIMQFQDTELWSGEKKLFSMPGWSPNNTNLLIKVASVGGFFFTLTQPAEYPQFQKVGVIQGNTLKFVWENQPYQVVSTVPILSGGGSADVWVYYDPNYVGLNPKKNGMISAEKWWILLGKGKE